MQRDAACGQRFQRQQGVVDAAQPARGHQQHRPALLRHVVDGQQLLGERHHQPPGTLQQHRAVARGQRRGGALDGVQVQRPLFQRGDLPAGLALDTADDLADQ